MSESGLEFKKASYPGLDIMRFFCSLLVVAIHVSPLTDINKYLNYGVTQYLARLAVPFFFTCSGFFLFRKIDRARFSFDPILAYCLKIARLYGTWAILLFVGSKVQFWYLSGVVVADVIVGLLVKGRTPSKWICIIGILLYCIGLLGDSYNGFVSGIPLPAAFQWIMKGFHFFFSTTRNGFFMGVIYVAIGMLFAYEPFVLNTRTAVLGFCLSMLFMLAEAFFLQYYEIRKDSNMYVFLVPAVFFLFYLAKEISLPYHPIFLLFRVTSMLVFFTHNFFSIFVSAGISVLVRLGFPTWLDHSLIRYFGTVCASVCFSLLIYWLSKKDRFVWLKWLFS